MNRDIIIVGGMTGWGKSLWGKLFTLHTNRLLVFDPTAQWPKTRFDEEEHGFEDLVDDLDPTGFLSGDRTKKVFRVGVTNPDHSVRLGAMSFMEGNNILVLEESSMLFEKGQRRLETWLNRLVFLGRHQRCSILVIAQRFMSVPIDVRSQANRIVTFNQHEVDDIQYLKSVFGKDAERINKLPKLTCLDMCNGQLFEYNIRERAEKELKIKIDMDQSLGYTAFYKSA